MQSATASEDIEVGKLPGELIGHRFFRWDGNVRLVVNNPAKFPFWYTICMGDKTIAKGYATELDFARKDNGRKGYSMQIAYLQGENARTIRGELPFTEKNISMEVKTAATVYPGQSAKVEVAVKDRKGRPVKNADVTAYAFTSKFEALPPEVTIYGKSASGKAITPKNYEADEDFLYNTHSRMDWPLWRQRMGLDSIEYYKFLYPEPFYAYTEEAPGRLTQLSPYVVVDGEVQGSRCVSMPFSFLPYSETAILAGPFPYRGFTTGGMQVGTLYSDTLAVNSFEIEGGYRYDIRNNYLKQQSWEQNPIQRQLEPFTQKVCFGQDALTAESIRGIFRRQLADMVENESGLISAVPQISLMDSCRLQLSTGKLADGTRAQPIMVFLQSTGKYPASRLYYGTTTEIDRLPEGNLRVDLIFRDTTRCSATIRLRKGGINYLRMDSLVKEPADDRSRALFGKLERMLRVSRPWPTASPRRRSGTTRCGTRDASAKPT